MSLIIVDFFQSIKLNMKPNAVRYFIYGEHNDVKGHAFINDPPTLNPTRRAIFLGDIVDLCEMTKSVTTLKGIFNNIGVNVPNIFPVDDIDVINDMFQRLFELKNITSFNVDSPCEMKTIPKIHDTCVVDEWNADAPHFTFIFGNHEIDLLSALTFPFEVTKQGNHISYVIESHYRDTKTKQILVDEIQFTLTVNELELIYYYLLLCQPYLIIKSPQGWSDLYIHSWKNAVTLNSCGPFRMCVCGHTRCYGLYVSTRPDVSNVGGYVLMCDSSHCLGVGNIMVCEYTPQHLKIDMFWPPAYFYKSDIIKKNESEPPEWLKLKFHKHSENTLT